MGDLFTKPDAKAGSRGRGITRSLWNQAPVTEIEILGFDDGFGIHDEFLAFDADSKSWTLTNATSGTGAIDPAAKGGVLLLD